MNYLQTGQFYGDNNQTLVLDGKVITDTKYEYEFTDWHYHENPHFAFITQGNLREGHKDKTYECSANTLLFHNRQEPHFNIKPVGETRGFQVELSPNWCQRFGIDLEKMSGSIKVTYPNIKLSFYNIYKESKIFDDTSNLAIDAMLLEIFDSIHLSKIISERRIPGWVKKIDEILHETIEEPPSLLDLSEELNLYSTHISRDFHKYFRCNLGEYIRKIRIEKAVSMLFNKNLSLTEISVLCGFADQSHFIRCFKRFHGITPKDFRKLFF